MRVCQTLLSEADSPMPRLLLNTQIGRGVPVFAMMLL